MTDTKKQADQLQALREPFPPERIGLLPRATRKDGRKGECRVCGKWHALPAIHLDYVGHGALTERLLDVDPYWTWEPYATDENGLPRTHRHGDTVELWIRLTVAGVTRIGVGTAAAHKPDLAKELIGDALRNAAMRFGAALDLWIKGDDRQEGNDDDRTRPLGVDPKNHHTDQVSKTTWQLMSDLVNLAGSKDLASQLWWEAATNHGLSEGDIAETEEQAADIYQQAIGMLAETRKVKVERGDAGDPGQVSWDVDEGGPVSDGDWQDNVKESN